MGSEAGERRVDLMQFVKIVRALELDSVTLFKRVVK
jgi:hypothetical protein